MSSQTKNKWAPADIVAKARVGQWVELEGIVQKDLSVLALEIEFLTGDADSQAYSEKIKQILLA